jgi:hypothetical protein
VIVIGLDREAENPRATDNEVRVLPAGQHRTLFVQVLDDFGLMLDDNLQFIGFGQ